MAPLLNWLCGESEWSKTYFLEKFLREKVRRGAWSLVWGRMRRERMICLIILPHMARQRDQGGSPGYGATPWDCMWQGGGWALRLRIWADCPRTAPQKLPKTGFSKKFIVCVFTLSECYNTIYREVVLLKRVQEISLMWSTGEPQSPAFDKVLAKHCGLRMWADCSRTALQKLPCVEHRQAAVDCVWQGAGWALLAENLRQLPKDR